MAEVEVKEQVLRHVPVAIYDTDNFGRNKAIILKQILPYANIMS